METACLLFALDSQVEQGPQRRREQHTPSTPRHFPILLYAPALRKEVGPSGTMGGRDRVSAQRTGRLSVTNAVMNWWECDEFTMVDVYIIFATALLVWCMDRCVYYWCVWIDDGWVGWPVNSTVKLTGVGLQSVHG